MNIEDYLSRIGFTGTLAPNVPTLKALQRAHLLAIPFENLDIHWQNPIVPDTAKFYDKMIVRQRGGFCYELNGLFNQLLKELGYETRLVSARVYNGKVHGPEFDHAAIIARVDDDEYLVDVGFGSFTTEPLRFVIGEKQQDDAGIFIIRKFDKEYLEVAKQEDGGWRSEYIFRDVRRELAEFAEMCDFQQYSPDSHFRKGKLCSIMIPNGRKTLTEKSFIVTTGDQKREFPVTSEAEFYSLLEREFGITAVSS